MLLCFETSKTSTGTSIANGSIMHVDNSVVRGQNSRSSAQWSNYYDTVQPLAAIDTTNYHPDEYVPGAEETYDTVEQVVWSVSRMGKRERKPLIGYVS